MKPEALIKLGPKPGTEEYIDALLQSAYDKGFTDCMQHRYVTQSLDDGFKSWKSTLPAFFRHRYDVLTGKVTSLVSFL